MYDRQDSIEDVTKYVDNSINSILYKLLPGMTTLVKAGASEDYAIDVLTTDTLDLLEDAGYPTESLSEEDREYILDPILLELHSVYEIVSEKENINELDNKLDNLDASNADMLRDLEYDLI